MAENKVKYGLKNVHVWPITEDTPVITYGAVIPIPGGVSLTLSAKGEADVFWADDVEYWSQFSNEGYDGDLEIASLPEAFETGILGYEKDKNGAIVEKVSAAPKRFAIAFEFTGDKNGVRHVFYNVSCSRPNVEGKTVEGKRAPQTDKLSMKAMPGNGGLLKAKLSADATGYAAFFEQPYVIVPLGA